MTEILPSLLADLSIETGLLSVNIKKKKLNPHPGADLTGLYWQKFLCSN